MIGWQIKTNRFVYLGIKKDIWLHSLSSKLLFMLLSPTPKRIASLTLPSQRDERSNGVTDKKAWKLQIHDSWAQIWLWCTVFTNYKWYVTTSFTGSFISVPSSSLATGERKDDTKLVVSFSFSDNQTARRCPGKSIYVWIMRLQQRGGTPECPLWPVIM